MGRLPGGPWRRSGPSPDSVPEQARPRVRMWRRARWLGQGPWRGKERGRGPQRGARPRRRPESGHLGLEGPASGVRRSSGRSSLGPRSPGPRSPALSDQKSGRRLSRGPAWRPAASAPAGSLAAGRSRRREPLVRLVPAQRVPKSVAWRSPLPGAPCSQGRQGLARAGQAQGCPGQGRGQGMALPQRPVPGPPGSPNRQRVPGSPDQRRLRRGQKRTRSRSPEANQLLMQPSWSPKRQIPPCVPAAALARESCSHPNPPVVIDPT